MARMHWSAPDVGADILAEALRPDAAPPVAIHVRPEVRARIGAQVGDAAVDRLDGVPLVVDDRIPSDPGYEIHRAVVPIVARGLGNRPAATSSIPAAAVPLAA